MSPSTGNDNVSNDKFWRIIFFFKSINKFGKDIKKKNYSL